VSILTPPRGGVRPPCRTLINGMSDSCFNPHSAPRRSATCQVPPHSSPYCTLSPRFNPHSAPRRSATPVHTPARDRGTRFNPHSAPRRSATSDDDDPERWIGEEF